jgi:drug/metabolite transporter (DMT)-like permease
MDLTTRINPNVLPDPPSPWPTRLAIAALLTTVFLWGTSAVFMRTTALTLSPENALALRFMVITVVMAAGLLLSGSWRVARADWPRLGLVALAGFGSSWFTIEGFARVAAGLGAVISMVEPIMIALLAWLVLRERPGPRFWIGIVVSLAGAAVLFWPDITARAADPVDPLGVLFLIGASASFAAYTIAAKPLLKRYTSFTVTAWPLLIEAGPIILLASRPLTELVTQTGLWTWAEILYLALFNTVIGGFLWIYGARHLPGAIVGSFLYLMPVIAVAAGYLILDEAITPFLIVGGAIMLVGVALAQFSRRSANGSGP